MSDVMEEYFTRNNRGLLSAKHGKDVFVLTKRFQEEGRYEFQIRKQTGNTELLTFYSCKNARFII